MADDQIPLNMAIREGQKIEKMFKAVEQINLVLRTAQQAEVRLNKAKNQLPTLEAEVANLQVKCDNLKTNAVELKKTYESDERHYKQVLKKSRDKITAVSRQKQAEMDEMIKAKQAELDALDKGYKAKSDKYAADLSEAAQELSTMRKGLERFKKQIGGVSPDA